MDDGDGGGWLAVCAFLHIKGEAAIFSALTRDCEMFVELQTILHSNFYQ